MAKKLDVTNPIYNDDDAAREHLETLLWPNGPTCPRCNVTGDRITKLQGKSTRPGVYKCKDCRKPFSVTVGTVMERSHVPLAKWVLAAQLMASSKKVCPRSSSNGCSARITKRPGSCSIAFANARLT